MKILIPINLQFTVFIKRKDGNHGETKGRIPTRKALETGIPIQIINVRTGICR